MRIKNVTRKTLELALGNVNKEHGYKLIFKRSPEQIGNYLHFTIQSERSGIPGARYSWTGRKLPAASWHAHGYLFDEILNLERSAIIKTAHSQVMFKDGSIAGNWEDVEIGSMFKPVTMSQTSIL